MIAVLKFHFHFSHCRHPTQFFCCKSEGSDGSDLDSLSDGAIEAAEELEGAEQGQCIAMLSLRGVSPKVGILSTHLPRG